MIGVVNIASFPLPFPGIQVTKVYVGDIEGVKVAIIRNQAIINNLVEVQSLGCRRFG